MYVVRRDTIMYKYRYKIKKCDVVNSSAMDVGHRVTSDENISSAGEIIVSEKLKPALSRNNRITVQRKLIFKKKKLNGY